MGVTEFSERETTFNACYPSLGRVIGEPDTVIGRSPDGGFVLKGNR
jgi:hypothetical protein